MDVETSAVEIGLRMQADLDLDPRAARFNRRLVNEAVRAVLRAPVAQNTAVHSTFAPTTRR